MELGGRGLTASLASGRRSALRGTLWSDRRLRARSPDARCSCAAGGGTAGGRPPVLRHAFACGCRAGYRCAQDLSRGHPDANPVRDPQLVEQLVEVPTVLYFLKQTVDVPFLGGGGRLADLQGFLPVQSSTASGS